MAEFQLGASGVEGQEVSFDEGVANDSLRRSPKRPPARRTPPPSAKWTDESRKVLSFDDRDRGVEIQPTPKADDGDLRQYRFDSGKLVTAVPDRELRVRHPKGRDTQRSRALATPRSRETVTAWDVQRVV